MDDLRLPNDSPPRKAAVIGRLQSRPNMERLFGGKRDQSQRRYAMWPDDRILKLFGIDSPILQAPMGRFVSPEMVIAVSEAGGLGGLGLANSAPDKARADLGVVRQRTSRPINVNFMCHRPPSDDPNRRAAWQRLLAP